MSQLSEIRSDVQANLPSGYHTTLLTDSKVDELINKFQNRVCRRFNYEFMKQEVTRSTVDEQQTYALPTAGDANWTELNSGTVLKYKDSHDCWLIDSNSYIEPLTKSFKKHIQDAPQFRDTSEVGVPTHWCIDQQYLWLFCKPDHDMNEDSAWTIHFVFYGYLADLSGDDATNWLTNNHPELLEYGATALCYEQGLDYEQAQYWEAKAAAVLDEIAAADLREKVSAIEDSMRPASGQSVGRHDYGHRSRNLTAHYE